MTKLSLAVFPLLVSLVVLLGANPSTDRADASHAGGMDRMSIDMDPGWLPANTNTSLGSQDVCGSIYENGILDAAEDAVDTLFVDITATNIPPSSAITGYSYTLDFAGPDYFEVVSQDSNGLLFASNSPPIDIQQTSDPLPDGDGSFHTTVIDPSTVPAEMESGSGVLDRLQITTSPVVPSGVYPLLISGAVHFDSDNNPRSPDSVSSALLEVNSACTNDHDADDVPDTVDNCWLDANPSQENLDGDTYGDACDPDDDNDGVYDNAESACGSDPIDITPPLSRPERLDGVFAGADEDGDTMVDEALPAGSENFDCDGDGYKGDGPGAGNTSERRIYSAAGTANDQDACGGTGWPADLAPTGPSLNKITLTDLSSFITGSPRKLNTDPGDPGYNVRWDLVTGNGAGPPKDISLTDLSNITLLFPPILNGAKAFGGPVCPWPP